MNYLNLADMLFSKREKYAGHTAYRFKKDDRWNTVTYGQAVEQAEKYAAGFASLGLQKGEHVAILSANRIEWALADYSVLALGAALAPLYPSLLPKQIEYIINDSQAKIVIVENEAQAEKINIVRPGLKTVEQFFIIDCKEENIKSPWQLFSSLAAKGETFLKKNRNYVTDSISTVNRNETATVIYTSGTTGEPKGAVLTHSNFLSNLDSVSQIFDCYPDDIFLSFLPLSHVLERTAGHYFPVYSAASIAYAESIDDLPANMLEIKPTLMISVPRLFEKMYAKILDNMESASPLKRKIFYRAIETGRNFNHKKENSEHISLFLQKKRNLASKLVFSKMKERMGGRLRFFVSGGAPLSAEIGEFFNAAGIVILEGYGLTETSPGITFNTPKEYRFGTVGKPIPDVEVKIAEDGEILTRGGHVMKGYLNKEEATKEVIDADGWFHTGDIGLFDDDGFLKITDRKKNIIVTAGGKNIAPQPIEKSLTDSPLIEQAVVIGDKRKFCSAIIVPAREAMISRARKENLAFNNYEDLLKAPETEKLFEEEIAARTEQFARYEKVKKFCLIAAPFTQESGELTPTLKIKRKVVEEKYKDLIDALYA